jgi:transketolase
MKEIDFENLKKKAKWVRRQILEMIASAKKGHIGGAFSCTDILVALYYGGILKHDSRNPLWNQRDRLILSKGHSGTALFAILADLGYFDAKELPTYCKNSSMLGGHPDRRIPGIEADTGSLGHGIGIGAGIALGAKMDGAGYRVFVLAGDGECSEGSVWEAIVFAAHHCLSNLTLIVDRNRQCVLDFTEDCAPLDPLANKLEAFGWEVRDIVGHSFKELLMSFGDLPTRTSSKPLAIIANTVKGKGVSFMEGKLKWHHSIPTGDELAIARKELDPDWPRD